MTVYIYEKLVENNPNHVKKYSVGVEDEELCFKSKENLRKDTGSVFRTKGSASQRKPEDMEEG